MPKARHHDDHLHLHRLVVKLIAHPKRLGGLGKTGLHVLQRHSRIALKADPHKEITRLFVVKLGAVGDIAAAIRKIIGNRGHDSTC